MIPKIIHYCWFGHNPKPRLAEKCIKSWKKFCPDYEVIEWNEDNYNISSAPLYVRQAYEAKKWAFVTDYVRLQVVYEHGGIYLDTDVELIKPLDSLLAYRAYFGFESYQYVNTGLGFGSEKGMAVIQEMLADYENISFVFEDGTYDLTSCPVRNTNILVRHGLKLDGSFQVLDESVAVLPSNYLRPYDDWKDQMVITDETISIHWFSGSWLPENVKREMATNLKAKRRKNLIHNIVHIPNRIAVFILGTERYESIKKIIKGSNIE